MASRTARLSPDDQALKRDVRAAIAAAGGQERAARFCRIGQQMLSNCGSPNVDQHLPIDAARDLDEVTRGAPGWPIILRSQASQIGCDVFERPDALPGSGDWHRRLAELTTEQGHVVPPLLVALADGSLTAREVIDADLIRETDQVIQQWVTIRAMLQQAVEG